MTKCCVGCGREKEVGSLQVVGGRLFYLCDGCPIESIPTDIINEMEENWVLKNIEEAKERRKTGRGFWS